MPGKQPEFAVTGAQNETDTLSLIGRLSAPVKVPREHDFGIDFFCQLYVPTAPRSISVTDVFTLQAKGMTEVLRFGGLRNNVWRNYEISWLRTLAIPLFLARVDGTKPELALYSLAPIWRVLWQTAAPFEIICTTEPPAPTTYQREEVTHANSGQQFGDGESWTVPIGPPFMSLTHADLADEAWSAKARDLLKSHIQIERQNMLMFHLRVAIHHCVEKWSTNSFGAPIVLSKAMFWSGAPGDNLRDLAAALAPVAVSLGVHLRWQNDRDAYLLIDILEWLKRRGNLDQIGFGLLEGLLATRAQGLDPGERRSLSS